MNEETIREKLVNFIKNDDYQQEDLQRLSELRGLPKEFLSNEGIFYIENTDEIYAIFDILDIDMEKLGITEDNYFLFTRGWIIPLFDYNDNIIMFVNYSNTRDKNKKYINIPLYKISTEDSEEGEKLHPNVKMIGLEMFPQALKEDRAFVVEGIFDEKRLKYEGIPTFGNLGTKLTEFQKQFYSRFTNIYYIKDIDSPGDIASEYFKKQVKQATIIELPILRLSNSDKLINDVDEFGNLGNTVYETEWREFISQLERMGNYGR